MPFVIALAVRDMHMTPDEAVFAATAGGARALRRGELGALGPGDRGDLVVLDAPEPAHLAYRPGVDLVETVVRAGRAIYSRRRPVRRDRWSGGAEPTRPAVALGRSPLKLRRTVIDSNVTAEPTVSQAKAAPSRRRPRRRLLEWVAVIVVAVLVAGGLRAFVVQAFYVPSGSMLPTLQLGDRILVVKVGYTIHRGDIVVFRRTPADTSTADADLVKRVIGLPGETISSSGDTVLINGEPDQRALAAAVDDAHDFAGPRRMLADRLRHPEDQDPSRPLFHDGRLPRGFRRQQVLGHIAGVVHRRQGHCHRVAFRSPVLSFLLAFTCPEPGRWQSARPPQPLRRRGAGMPPARPAAAAPERRPSDAAGSASRSRSSWP